MTKKATAICVGDTHFRNTQPKCRLDDFWRTQIRKAKWLRQLWYDHDKPLVFQVGDLFESWKSDPEVIHMIATLLPGMITIPGNPGRHNNTTEPEKDALSVIKLLPNWTVLEDETQYVETEKAIIFACPYIGDIKNIPNIETTKRKVLIAHKMLLDGPAAFDGYQVEDFMKQNNQFDLIVTGHNHKPIYRKFYHEFSHITFPQVLIQPGSLTRQSIDETHLSQVVLWYAEDNTFEIVHIPIDENVISTAHVDEKEMNDDQFGAFIELLEKSQTTEITIKYKENVKAFLSTNNSLLSAGVKERMLKAIGEA
jgi:predicted phosphodiesterase